MKYKSEQKIVSMIQALLAKAESTNFEEEAATFMAKAQELIARYSIDALTLDETSYREEPTQLSVMVEAPYAKAKFRLLSQTARANHCRSMWLSSNDGCCAVIGFAQNLDMVELLFASLLVQGTKAVALAQKPSWEDTRSFRHSFWLAYAMRIGQRLRDATERVELESRNLLPVLQDRDQAVDLTVVRLYPLASPMRSRAASSHGWAAGTSAADSANLGVNQRLPAG